MDLGKKYRDNKGGNPVRIPTTTFDFNNLAIAKSYVGLELDATCIITGSCREGVTNRAVDYIRNQQRLNPRTPIDILARFPDASITVKQYMRDYVPNRRDRRVFLAMAGAMAAVLCPDLPLREHFLDIIATTQTGTNNPEQLFKFKGKQAWLVHPALLHLMLYQIRLASSIVATRNTDLFLSVIPGEGQNIGPWIRNGRRDRLISVVNAITNIPGVAMDWYDMSDALYRALITDMITEGVQAVLGPLWIEGWEHMTGNGMRTFLSTYIRQHHANLL